MEFKELYEKDLTTPLKPDYANEIIEIIRSKAEPDVICELLDDYHENDIAEVLPLLSIEERQRLYDILDIDTLSEILEYAETDESCLYLNEINPDLAADILEVTDSDTALEIIQALDEEKKEDIIELMDEEAKSDLVLMASFDEEEIGSKMTTNYIVIPSSSTVKQAMSLLVKQASENDNISTIFVVNESEEFYGAIDLKELIIARKETELETLIMTSYPYVYGHENIDDCIEQLKDYSEDLIPVLDAGKKLIGVITSQNMIEVIDEEMGEDYAMLAGLTGEEDLKEPLLQSMKKRLPWLFILLFLGMFVSSVVGLFEAVVSELTIIMCFQSLILGMAGNVGTQSLAVTIRVLADENLQGKQKLKLVLKEMKIGLTNGLILGTASFLILGLYIWLIKDLGLLMALAISACIGISLLIAMLFSSTVGTLIPLFFEKIHVDPAVASGPLITTINDLIAVITYYGLSWILLLNLLNLGI